MIAPNVPHECKLEGDAEMLVLYVEPELVRRAARRKISGIVVAEAAEQEVVPWMLASLLRHVCSRGSRPDLRTIAAVGGEHQAGGMAAVILGLQARVGFEGIASFRTLRQRGIARARMDVHVAAAIANELAELAWVSGSGV